MRRIGVDPAGIRIMAPKQFHYNLKVDGLSPAQANVIKQEMLSLGGEAAVARGAASCTVPSSGAILSGTLRQFGLLLEKLKYQSFGLSGVGEALSVVLENISKRDMLLKGRDKEWHLGRKTIIMGILNVTPDSFSDGGRFLDRSAAIDKALKMAEEGSDWIDIGGESTRPGAKPVAVEEELGRVLPVVEALSGKGLTVSVDTTKAKVAEEALKAGAQIINDVSALRFDADMARVVAEFKCPLILMHMRGTPGDMQKDVVYKDLTGEVYNFLSERVECAVSSGIGRDRLVIDPGLGFGKSREGNIELITRLREFRSMGLPILIGASRKSFIGKTIGANEDGRLIGSIAMSVAAIQNGADILRVHDVKETVQAARMADEMKALAR
ncbi:MAG: dihydropteroate synthase [Deltaproteobacteria bacterium]|nr:dihydropteroate synthase [Deltaproteobacteria bacterium]